MYISSTTKLIKLSKPQAVKIINGVHYSREKCILDFFGEPFEIYIVENDFPINVSGILGLGWELQFKAKINRAIDEYIITANNVTYALKLSKHPLALVPKNTISHEIRILSKHPDGFYFVDGPQIVPGVYESKNSEWKLLTFNLSDHVQFVHREDLIIKPRDDFVAKTEEEPEHNSTSIYRELFNNKLSPDERQHALKKYYEKLNANNFSCHVSDSQHVRIDEIQFKFDEQIINIRKDINLEAAQEIRDIIEEFHDVFALPDDPLPCVEGVTHKIKLNTDKVISTPLYKHPIFMQKEIEEQIEKFKRQGLIRDSYSPYQSNVWFVPRKLDRTGKKRWRLVMDFRKLNFYTIQDNFPLPSIEEILCLLGRAKYMSAFDMSNGFHAVKVQTEDIEKTAFSTHKGHWEWVRMPMGLINAPATYQRMINFKLRGLIGTICFVYVDDLIVFGSTIEEHAKNLRTVFNRLRETKLSLNPDKCSFLQKNLEYLGHEVTADGIKPLKRNVDKILNYPVPTTRHELERFIGLASYYRKFIQNFAKKTYHLSRMKSKNIDFEFSEQCKLEFENVKKLIGSYPIMAHPDMSKPFILHTDACNEGLGATLSQIGADDKEHPISFKSRALNPTEKAYSATEKELLGAVWAMKEHKHLLYGQKFDLYTDHEALKGIFNNKSNDVSSRIVRLLSKTTDYFPNIIYKRGKENVVADALSRLPKHEYVTTRRMLRGEKHRKKSLNTVENPSNSGLDSNRSSPEREIHNDESDACSKSSEGNQSSDEDQIQDDERVEKLDDPCLEVLPQEHKTFHCGKNAFLWLDSKRSTHLLKIFERTKNKTKKFIVSKYITDEDLRKISQITDAIVILENITKIPPIPILETDDLSKANHEIEGARLQNVGDIETLINISKEWKDGDIISLQAISVEEYNRACNILNAFLYWSRLNINIRKFLPKYVHNKDSQITLLAKIHEKHHWGVEKCYQELKINYIWDGMKNQLKEYIEKCNTCAPLRRTYKHTAAGVIISAPTEPFQIINCDLFTNNGKLYLVFIDELSRYVWVHQNVNKKHIYKHLRSFFLQHGIPKKLIADNGKEFDNYMVENTCKSFGIRKIPISAYHPESNGVCERVIGTLKHQLEKTNDVSLAVFQYNNSIHSVLQRMPINVLYGIKPKIISDEPDREKEIETARQDVTNRINKQKEVNKNLVDSRQSINKQYNIGDLVELYVQRNNKAAWSEATPIITCNKETKTITARLGNALMQRHFNQIRHHTQNRDLLTH